MTLTYQGIPFETDEPTTTICAEHLSPTILDAMDKAIDSIIRELDHADSRR